MTNEFVYPFRLRVREEVDVLQHLRRAYVGQNHGHGHGYDKWHPNVLGIVDAWEEDEALFIRNGHLLFSFFAQNLHHISY